MKRFLSLLIAVLMVVGMLPVVSMADTEYENILLTAENFVLGDYATAGDGGINTEGLTNKLVQNSIKVARSVASTAKVYIAESGTYKVCFLTGACNADTTRVPKVKIGEIEKTLEYSDGMTWKCENMELSAGWNDVTITTNGYWLPWFFNALYITSNLEAEITTDNDESLLSYSNTTSPVFADDAEITYSFAEGACSLTFPEATDDNAIIYEYTIDGNTVEVSDITQPVNVGSVASETDVVLTASDKWGNSAEISATIVPETITPTPDPEPEDEYENILLSGDNFDVPAYTNGGYINNGGTATGNLFEKSMKINDNGNVVYTTAKIYIEVEGTYNAWVLSANESADTTERYAKIGFDDETMQSATKHKLHAWDKTTWTLTAGWHDVKLGINDSWSATLINAVYITDDLEYTPTVDIDDELKQYHDTTTPVFAANADITTSFENASCSITFPAATDNTTVYYEYTLGDSTTEIADITAPVSVDLPAGESTITLAAYDKWGNKSEKSFNVTAPRNKWMLTMYNFLKPTFDDTHASAWVYIDATARNYELTSKSIRMNTNNTSVNGEKIYETASTNARGTAYFYVEAQGEYSIWCLTENYGGYADRKGAIYIDDEKSEWEIAPKASDTDNYKNYRWNKAVTKTLTSGWHKIEFGMVGSWVTYDMNAVYVTGDSTETVTIDNDDELLASYGDSSLCIDGDYYLTDGLEKGGYVIDDASVNITPVVGVSTSDSTHTVAMNGSSAAWNTANAVTLNKGINTVVVDSTDDTVDCTFPVVSTAKVINHIDSAATITGGVGSSIVGYDGVTTAIYLDGASSTAKFSAKDVIGKAKVAIYVVGAEGKDASVAADAQVAVSHKSGITDKKPDTSRTEGGWIELGTYDFSGSDDEYVEIKGQDGAHVYIDSVKFVYADEYLFSEPVISTDGKFSVTYDCYKQTDDDTTIAAIAAKYTGDVMNGASVNRLTHTDKGIYKITTNAFDITAGASYKAFIWDSTDNATPLAGAVTYPTAAE